MKELLTVISLLVSGVIGRDPASYPASGWRPSGPAFELPLTHTTSTQIPQQYLPPVDPRVPPRYNPDNDVSVQGLPTQEQLPLFQPSPVNGQQYGGADFNSDIKNLDVSFRQSQFQNQQQIAREFDRQRQLDAAQSANSPNRVSEPQKPAQIVPITTVRPTNTTPRLEEVSTTQVSSTTDNSLNEGEILHDDSGPDSSFARQKVSVEVSKQNIQEFPPELFLSPLPQLRLQPQLAPLQQFGQLKFNKQQQGFDSPAHFSALSSILAQQQLLSNQQFQSQQAFVQNPRNLGQEPTGFVSQNPDQPLNQYQINRQYQPLVQPQMQYQAQHVIVPQKVNQVPADREKSDDAENSQNESQPAVQIFQPQSVQAQAIPSLQPQAVQPQVYQPPIQVYQSQPDNYQPQTYQPVQPQFYQPQTYQPQSYQPQNYQPHAYRPSVQVYQPQDSPQAIQPQLYPQQTQETFAPQGQLIGFSQDLSQYYQTLQSQKHVQGSLQSGLQGQDENIGIENKEEPHGTTSRDESTATVVATAFGARTQPRVLSKYGATAAAPVPRREAPESQTTTESTVERKTMNEDECSILTHAIEENTFLRCKKITEHIVELALGDTPIPSQVFSIVQLRSSDNSSSSIGSYDSSSSITSPSELQKLKNESDIRFLESDRVTVKDNLSEVSTVPLKNQIINFSSQESSKETIWDKSSVFDYERTKYEDSNITLVDNHSRTVFNNEILFSARSCTNQLTSSKIDKKRSNKILQDTVVNIEYNMYPKIRRYTSSAYKSKNKTLINQLINRTHEFDKHVLTNHLVVEPYNNRDINQHPKAIIPSNEVKINSILQDRMTAAQKETCAEQYREGFPTSLPELLERLVSKIDFTMKRLQDKVSDNIIREIRKQFAQQTQPIPNIKVTLNDIVNKPVIKLPDAEGLTENERIDEFLQFDLIQNEAIDKLTRHFNIDIDSPTTSKENFKPSIIKKHLTILKHPDEDTKTDMSSVIVAKPNQSSDDVQPRFTESPFSILNIIFKIPFTFIRENAVVIASVPLFFFGMLFVYVLLLIVLN